MINTLGPLHPTIVMPEFPDLLDESMRHPFLNT